MSRLEDESVAFRKIEIAKNAFNQNNEYSNGNPQELSPVGKETANGDTGSAIDIATRKTLIAKNKFNYNKEYNLGTA